MSPLTIQQRGQIIALLRSGESDRDRISGQVGVSPGAVSAVKAHLTMESYGTGAVLAEARATAEELEELRDAAETTFGLERDLQRALRSNVDQLEPGLRIVDDGRERGTDAGRIDILAEDASGRLVIIELKAGTAQPESVAQILGYMGALAESERREMRGILVAGDFAPRVVSRPVLFQTSRCAVPASGSYLTRFPRRRRSLLPTS